MDPIVKRSTAFSIYRINEVKPTSGTVNDFYVYISFDNYHGIELDSSLVYGSVTLLN